MVKIKNLSVYTAAYLVAWWNEPIYSALYLIVMFIACTFIGQVIVEVEQEIIAFIRLSVFE